MAKRIKFRDFKNLVKNREITKHTLHDYLEEDPSSATPKLRFKTDALTDQVPVDYNVDIEIYNMIRSIEKDRNIEMFGLLSKPDIVAEGDSWFRHHWFFGFPDAIATVIDENENFNMDNIAHWGDTIFSILSKKEYMKSIDANDTEYFMLSGGGNDIQDGINEFIHRYTEDRPLERYLTEDGEKALVLIGQQYSKILTEVSTAFPKVKILCHGYDYPRPSNGSKYIGKYLQAKGIPEDKMKAIISSVIDKLNFVIKAEVNKISQAAFISLLGESGVYTWYDDMHPDDDGFAALAKKFETMMMPID